MLPFRKKNPLFSSKFDVSSFFGESFYIFLGKNHFTHSLHFYRISYRLINCFMLLQAAPLLYKYIVYGVGLSEIKALVSTDVCCLTEEQPSARAPLNFFSFLHQRALKLLYKVLDWEQCFFEATRQFVPHPKWQIRRCIMYIYSDYTTIQRMTIRRLTKWRPDFHKLTIQRLFFLKKKAKNFFLPLAGFT